jgi:ABC-type sugar transport system permease subunit
VKKNKNSIFYLMNIPLLITIAVMFVYPIVSACYLGFFRSGPMTGTKFIGFGNYNKIFSDSIFLWTILRTFLYAGGVVVLNVVIGLGYAVLTYRNKVGVRILRTIMIIPMLFVPAISAVTWNLLYQGQIGLIPNVLEAVGLPKLAFLSNPKTALFAVMVVDIWAWTPYVFLILLAGLQGLDESTLEAAEIDGATRWKRFWLVMLPMIKPAITVAIIIKALDTFRSFTYVAVMTQGGPGDSSHILSTFIYTNAFRHFRYGLGSSMAVIAMLLAFTLALSLLFAFKER